MIVEPTILRWVNKQEHFDEMKVLKILTCFTELCLLFCRGGKYTEDDAKAVLIQILNFVSFCHLQGVVHRDLKPEVGDIIKLTLINDCQALDLTCLIIKCIGTFVIWVG